VAISQTCSAEAKSRRGVSQGKLFQHCSCSAILEQEERRSISLLRNPGMQCAEFELDELTFPVKG